MFTHILFFNKILFDSSLTIEMPLTGGNSQGIDSREYSLQNNMSTVVLAAGTRFPYCHYLQVSVARRARISENKVFLFRED